MHKFRHMINYTFASLKSFVENADQENLRSEEMGLKLI
jgi:hypothetical protein